MATSTELVEVYSTDDVNEAEVLRLALQDQGVRCEIDGRGQAGLTGIGIMQVKLFVPTSDFDRARAYLTEHVSPSSRTDEDADTP